VQESEPETQSGRWQKALQASARQAVILLEGAVFGPVEIPPAAFGRASFGSANKRAFIAHEQTSKDQGTWRASQDVPGAPVFI
jgi:hypothetical protein